jgi:hypothetical protein
MRTPDQYGKQMLEAMVEGKAEMKCGEREMRDER